VNTLFSVLVLAQAVTGSAPVGQPPAPPPAPIVQAAPVAAPVAQPAGAQIVASAPSAAPMAAAPVALPPMQAAQDPQGSMWTTLIFFGVMILVFWLLIIRPQSKQKKKHETFLSSLKSGDKVVTGAGFIGRIVSVEGDVVTIELARDVRVRVVKAQVVSTFKEEGEAKNV